MEGQAPPNEQLKQRTPGIKGQKAIRVPVASSPFNQQVGFGFDTYTSGVWTSSVKSQTTLKTPACKATPTAPFSRRLPSSGDCRESGFLASRSSAPKTNRFKLIAEAGTSGRLKTSQGATASTPTADVGQQGSAIRKKSAMRVPVDHTGASTSSIGWTTPSCSTSQRGLRELRALAKHGPGGNCKQESAQPSASMAYERPAFKSPSPTHMAEARTVSGFSVKSAGRAVQSAGRAVQSSSEDSGIAAPRHTHGAAVGPQQVAQEAEAGASAASVSGRGVKPVEGQAPTTNTAAGQQQQQPLGRVLVLSAVKASREVKEKLGSKVVLTPVRRSARKSTNPVAPVEVLLEATNFAYTPNLHLTNDALANR